MFIEESFDSNILQSMIFRVLRRWSLNSGQWRGKRENDSIFKLQLQSGFKIVLENIT